MSSRTPLKIWVVDDEEMLRELIELTLSPHFSVTTYSSAEALLDALSGAPPDLAPDLVLLDVGLPGMNGFQACREIRRRYRDLPVVFLSGHDNAESRQEGRAAGGNDFIIKPFAPDALVHRLRALRPATPPGSAARAGGGVDHPA